MNPDNFVYFVKIVHSPRNFSFDSYNDETGRMQFVPGNTVTGNDGVQHVMPRRFSFNKSHRTIRIPKHQKEVIEFLRNSPFCEGSPIAGKRPLYREMNEARDAKISVDAKKARLEAANKVLSLTFEELVEIGSLFGKHVSGKGENVEATLQHYLLERAEADPEPFLEVFKDPHKEERSIIRKCIASKMFEVSGELIIWKETEIGVDEDSAVAKLVSDKRLKRSVVAAMKKAGA